MRYAGSRVHSCIILHQYTLKRYICWQVSASTSTLGSAVMRVDGECILQTDSLKKQWSSADSLCPRTRGLKFCVSLWSMPDRLQTVKSLRWQHQHPRTHGCADTSFRSVCEFARMFFWHRNDSNINSHASHVCAIFDRAFSTYELFALRYPINRSKSLLPLRGRTIRMMHRHYYLLQRQAVAFVVLVPHRRRGQRVCQHASMCCALPPFYCSDSNIIIPCNAKLRYYCSRATST